jgi:hypothetical protein
MTDKENWADARIRAEIASKLAGRFNGRDLEYIMKDPALKRRLVNFLPLMSEERRLEIVEKRRVLSLFKDVPFEQLKEAAAAYQHSRYSKAVERQSQLREQERGLRERSMARVDRQRLRRQSIRNFLRIKSINRLIEDYNQAIHKCRRHYEILTKAYPSHFGQCDTSSDTFALPKVVADLPRESLLGIDPGSFQEWVEQRLFLWNEAVENGLLDTNYATVSQEAFDQRKSSMNNALGLVNDIPHMEFKHQGIHQEVCKQIDHLNHHMRVLRATLNEEIRLVNDHFSSLPTIVQSPSSEPFCFEAEVKVQENHQGLLGDISKHLSPHLEQSHEILNLGLTLISLIGKYDESSSSI